MIGNSIMDIKEMYGFPVTSVEPLDSTPDGKFVKYSVSYNRPIQSIGGSLSDYINETCDVLVCSSCCECKDVSSTFSVKDGVFIKCNVCGNEEFVK